MGENKKNTGQIIRISDELDKIVEKYSKAYRPMNQIGKLWRARNHEGSQGGAGENFRRGSEFARKVNTATFEASHLEKIVEEIKLIEEGLKSLVAARTKKIVEEKVPVEKQRPVKFGLIRKCLLALGLIGPKMETYTDYETVKKEVPRRPDEVAISEFRTMIDRYIESLKKLNNGLGDTVCEVAEIVRNLTDVSDNYTDEIHGDRKAYFDQINHSRRLEKQLNEIVQLHESLSPVDDRFPAIEKARDHLEMALRDSQGMEFKFKTNIDMGVNYQNALKSYRKLINDFRERGDLHVNMVEKFAEGASHMKIAVDNVSRICSGVAKVTQSMIMIVESIESGNQVLGKYAALIGDQVPSGRHWDMEYEQLKQAETVYQKNDRFRMRQLENNRKEIELLISSSPGE